MTMAEIKFSTEEKALLVHKLKDYFDKELDQEIGQFDCEFLLDFISKELGAHYYNKGLTDAQTIVSSKLDDITDAFYEMEIATGR
jgi:uncharacterized protein (DUF2164 family)